jgi:hypothetical protein
MGGRFQDGFLSAAFSTLAMDMGLAEMLQLGTPGDGNFAKTLGRTAVAGIVGGTAAEIGGGKFANGAYTAAFQHLLNAEGKPIADDLKKIFGQDATNSCVCASIRNMHKLVTGEEVSEQEIQGMFKLGPEHSWNYNGVNVYDEQIVQILNKLGKKFGQSYNREILTEKNLRRIGVLSHERVPILTFYRVETPKTSKVGGHAVVLHGLTLTKSGGYFHMYDSQRSVTKQIIWHEDLSKNLYKPQPIIYPVK